MLFTPNFVNFAPFGMVMVIMIAIGVSEHCGLISAAVRKMVLVPLGAVVFYGIGRHPLAGIISFQDRSLQVNQVF